MKRSNHQPEKPTTNLSSFRPYAVALTIGGSDSCGGAGIQADLKTFQQLGVHGASALTLVTAQNSVGVQRLELLSPSLIIDQIDSVVDDFQPSAAKTGALGNAAIIDAVAERAESFTFPLIVDPVMISKHGDSLIDEDAVEAYRRLLKRAWLVTPNRFELARLTGISLDSEDSIARAIHDLHMMGARYVLAKMGEVDGVSHHIFGTGATNTAINIDRFPTLHTHGAGCVLSAAITGWVALGEEDALSIVNRAIRQVAIAIYNAHPIASGRCPIETRALMNVD